MRSPFLAALLPVLMLAAGSANAQISTENTIDFVSDTTGIKLGPQRNGHDKCNGVGHTKDGGGGGHDEGECDDGGETPTEPGPAASVVCDASAVVMESSWQRYTCTVAAYNEDYLTGTIAANESYPEVLAAYATTEATALQAATTSYVTAVSTDLAAGNFDGAIETTGGFTFGALDRYLPGAPIPAPGPVIDEALLYTTTTVDYVSAGDIAGAAESTGAFTFGALDRYLPGAPIPAPGPVIDEALLYTTTTVDYVSAGDIAGAAESTGAFTFGALDRYLPGAPIPAPGPVIDEYRVIMPSGF